MNDICGNCGKRAIAFPALGAWPRCQHKITGRDFDPYAQCIWKSRHSGCHKAQYPDGVEIWSCVAE